MATWEAPEIRLADFSAQMLVPVCLCLCGSNSGSGSGA
jgi:hypothetical protein